MDLQSFINNDSTSILSNNDAAKIGSKIGSMLVRMIWDSIIDEAKEELKRPHY